MNDQIEEFKSQYRSYIKQDSRERSNQVVTKPSLREDISDILQDVVNKDTEIRLRKLKYQEYCAIECNKTLAPLIKNQINIITENIMKSTNLKLNDLAKNLQRGQENSISVPIKVEYTLNAIESHSNKKDNLPDSTSLGKRVAELARDSVGLATSLMVALERFGRPGGLVTAALFGVYEVSMTVSWTKSGAIDNLPGILTEAIRSNSELHDEIFNAMNSRIRLIEKDLKSIARDFFIQMKSSDQIPSCEIYQDLKKYFMQLKNYQ